MAVGRTDDARRAVGDALAVARTQGERGNEATALRIVAEIASTAAPVDVAHVEQCYEKARALAHALGMAPEAARCQLGLGRLLARVGRSEDARRTLAAATSAFEKMQMTAWARQAALTI